MVAGAAFILPLPPDFTVGSPILADRSPSSHQMTERRRGEEGFDDLVSSIERSRKRHLDEGLLRGDQVRDRLRVQEASASPALKKTRASPNTPPSSAPEQPTPSVMALTMADFRDYMEKNTNKRLGDIDGKISGMQQSIKENTDKLNKHESQIEKIREEVKKLKDDPFPPLAGRGDLTVPAAPIRAEQDDEFFVARRSIRLWPIRGKTEDELWHSAGIFLGTTLGLEGKIDGKAIQSVKRVTIPSGPGVTDEALVVFAEVVTRDQVMGSAARLAPFMDQSGRATAGMRMEVPPRLQQAFRVLFKYGQRLRARHGAGTRRHVKFCDLERSLYLNIKLPGDEAWSRVSLSVAMRGIKARDNINDDQLERRLDITGPLADAPRQRSSSLAGPPPPTEASAWMRRGSTAS